MYIPSSHLTFADQGVTRGLSTLPWDGGLRLDSSCRSAILCFFSWRRSTRSSQYGENLYAIPVSRPHGLEHWSVYAKTSTHILYLYLYIYILYIYIYIEDVYLFAYIVS